MLWHYTAGLTLPEILRSGVLLPSASCARERPAVWFTLRRDWDPATALGYRQPADVTARAICAWLERGAEAGIAMIPARNAADLGGLARVGVAPGAAPYGWEEFVSASRLEPLETWARAEVDRALGSNPEDWRVSFDPVPASSWLAVEVRSGTRAGERWEPWRRNASA